MDDADADLPFSVSVEAPDGNAFWSLHVYERDADPDELLKETVSNLNQTYPDLEISSYPGDFPNQVVAGLETMFYCLDFLVRVRLQVVSLETYQILLWFQAEDRDFDRLELVFKAISTSLLSSLKAA